MTEQFSQEYKAFMHKAKALQKLWVPGEGDWYTFLGADRAYLLDYPLDPRLGGVDDDVRWLPTLFQLIRVIEGRWPNIQTHIWSSPYVSVLIRVWDENVKEESESDGLHWCRKCRKKEPCPHQAWAEGKDLLLAAAQLAVRALEGDK